MFENYNKNFLKKKYIPEKALYHLNIKNTSIFKKSLCVFMMDKIFIYKILKMTLSVSVLVAQSCLTFCDPMNCSP